MLSKEVSLKDGENIKSLEERISGELFSVAVHIRRGDYLNLGAGAKVLGVDYYKDAVSCIKSNIQTPKYYIFSDDIEWVKKEMGDLFTDVYYVSSEGFSECEEFVLMKACTHAITANSTFSWFSVLLTNKDTKIVIYPKDWKNPYLQGDTNICPPNWLSV